MKPRFCSHLITFILITVLLASAYFHNFIYIEGPGKRSKDSIILKLTVLSLIFEYILIEGILALFMAKVDDDVYIPLKRFRTFNLFEVPRKRFKPNPKKKKPKKKPRTQRIQKVVPEPSIQSPPILPNIELRLEPIPLPSVNVEEDDNSQSLFEEETPKELRVKPKRRDPRIREYFKR